MFAIGFFELILIAIVALFVIGPERLPHVARSAGLWIGKMRGFVSSVKSDIDQELKAEELKLIRKQHADSTGVHEIIEETKSATNDVKEQDYLLRAIVDDDDKEKTEKEVKQPADDDPDPLNEEATESGLARGVRSGSPGPSRGQKSVDVEPADAANWSPNGVDRLASES